MSTVEQERIRRSRSLSADSTKTPANLERPARTTHRSHQIFLLTLLTLPLLLAILALNANPATATELNCTFKTSCAAGETGLIKINNMSVGPSNAHAELMNYSGSYPYTLCCAVDALHRLNNSCADENATVVVRAHAQSNTHIQIQSVNDYDYDVCLASAPGNLSCTYTNGTCAAGYTGMLSMASSEDNGGLYNMTNAHAANYTQYLASVCCKIAGAPPTITSIILNFTNAANTTNYDLVAWPTVTEPDGGHANLAYNWYLNGTPITILNMDFDVENQPAAGQTRDLSDYANHGTLGTGVHAPVYTATGGVNGSGAYVFDGNDTFINITNSIPALNGTDITVEAWVKGSGGTGDPWMCLGGYCAILTQYTQTYDGYYLYLDASISASDTRPAFWGANDAEARSADAITPGVWHHIVGTANSTHLAIYVDGVRKGTASWSGRHGVDHMTYIGGDDNTNAPGRFNGTIDNVRVWNRSLSAGEIYLLYLNETDHLDSQETVKTDEWMTCAVANDAESYSTMKCSNNVTILNSPPTISSVKVVATDSPANETTANLTATLAGPNDNDNDDIYYAYDWRLNGTSIAVLNMNFDVNNSGGAGITKDYSMYGNDGIVRGAIWNGSGGYNNSGAYEFPASGDFIDVGNDSSLNVGDGDFSVELWAKQDNFNKQCQLVTKNLYWSTGAGYTITNGANPTCVNFVVNNGTDNANRLTNACNNHSWTHIVGVKEGGSLRVYVNGTQYGVDTDAPKGSYDNKYNVTIGDGPTGAGINGSIDNLRIYKRALSAEEVRAHYNNELHLYLSGSTTKNENYSVCVTPNDLEEDGTEVCSENLTIQPDIPDTPTLIYPVNGNSSVFERNVTLDWSTVTEADGDTVTYNLTLEVAAGTCAVEHAVAAIADSNYTTDELCTDQRYNWTVQACDVDGCSSWATHFNFTIASTLGVTYRNDLTNFSTFERGQNASTEAGDGEPLAIENTGNVYEHIDFRANVSLFSNATLNSSNFQYKVAANETNAFNLTSSQTTWANVTINYTVAFFNLSYIDELDDGLIHLNVSVPWYETPGLKTTYVFVQARTT